MRRLYGPPSIQSFFGHAEVRLNSAIGFFVSRAEPLRKSIYMLATKNGKLTRTLQFVAPPRFENRAMDRTAAWTNLLISVTIVTVIVLLCPLPFSDLPQNTKLAIVVGDSVTLAISICAWVLLRKGYVQVAASIILIILFSALFYADLVIFQTIRTPGALGFVVLIPMAGLLLGQRAMILSVVLSCLALFVIFWMEWVGLLTPTFNTIVTVNDLVVPTSGYWNTHDRPSLHDPR